MDVIAQNGVVQFRLQQRSPHLSRASVREGKIEREVKSEGERGKNQEREGERQRLREGERGKETDRAISPAAAPSPPARE